MLAAQQYYVDYGNDMQVDRLQNMLSNYIPDYMLQNNRQPKALEKWIQLVLHAYRKVCYVFIIILSPNLTDLWL